MKLRSILLCMMLFLLLAVISVAQENTPEPTVPPVDLMELETLQLRFAHFSLDAGVLDVYINDARFIEALSFQQVTEWLTTVPDTPITLAFVPAGGALSDAIMISEPLVFAPGNWITIAITGRADNDALRIQPITEDYSPIQRGEARLSLIHAMSNQPPLDVSSNGVQIARALSNPASLLDGEDGLLTVNIRRGEHRLTFSLSNGTPVFTSNTLRLGENRNYLVAVMGPLSNPLFVLNSTDFAQEIPLREIVLPEAGELPVITPEMTAEATENPEATTVPESTDTPLAELTIEAESTAEATSTALTPTVIPIAEATDSAEATPEITENAEATPEAETTPESTASAESTPELSPAAGIGLEPGMMRLRVTHLAPGTEALDIYLNGDVVIDGLGFSGVSSPIDVEAMEYELVLLAPERTEDLILYRSQIQLLPGAVMTLAIIGSVETESLAVQPLVENYAPIEAGLSRLNVFQGIPDAQFLRLVANNTRVIVSGLNFPGIFDETDTGYFSVDMLAGTYRMRLEDENGNLLTATEIRMGSGRTYLLIAAGLTGNAFFLLESDALPVVIQPQS